MANDIIPGAGKKFDIAMTVVFWLLAVTLMWKTPRPDLGVLLILFILAVEAVDFAVGVVHWALDKYWDYDHQRLGGLVKTFRGHHVDPELMLKHGILKSNNNALPVGVVMALLMFTLESPNLIWFFIFFVVFGAYSATIHQWAHRDDLPAAIKKLQDWNVLISPKLHEKHHEGYWSHYCAITGHWNPILDKVNFWRRVEYVIYRLTNAVPYHRRDTTV